MAEQGREQAYGAYPRMQQQPPAQQPYPYPQQAFALTPYGHPAKTRSAGEFAALMTASVLTAVVGVCTGFLAFIVFLGLGMAPSSSFEPGERARQEAMGLFLCPGPFVALGFAWGGYAVLRRLKHPSAAAFRSFAVYRNLCRQIRSVRFPRSSTAQQTIS